MNLQIDLDLSSDEHTVIKPFGSMSWLKHGCHVCTREREQSALECVDCHMQSGAPAH